MGNTCCNRKKEKKKIVLLLVGLDNAGKSVAVKGLAGESLDTVVPTVGLSVVYLKYNDFVVKVFDLGGGSNIRGIWQRYFVDAHGVIFVVDSSDYLRLDEAKEVLQDLLSHEKISGKPILLLANKQDQKDALDELDLVEKLQLEPLVNKEHCPTLVESCSATDLHNRPNSKTKVDPGIQKGYRWLLNYIVRDYQNLNARVERDVKQQEIEEHEARLEKIERLRKSNEAAKVDDDLIESFSDYDRKLNGEITSLKQNSFDDQKEIYYIHTACNYGDSTSYSSSKSNQSFPLTYFDQESPPIRPKSAVQLVKQQLELESSQRRPFISLKLNKTAPVNLYGVRHPQSASERREHFANERRALKSADDSTLFLTALPNSVLPDPQVDELHRELFHLNNFQKMQKLPPIKMNKSLGEDNHQWAQKPYKSGISIVEID